MAGRLMNYGTYRFLLVVLTLILVGTILSTAGVWRPLPDIQAWWARVTMLSDPAPAWTARLGAEPDLTAIVGTGQVITAAYDTVTAYGRAGEVDWTKNAYWAITAGDVVVLRQKPNDPNKRIDRGYSAVDPASGAVLWSDASAIAVWIFADKLLDLTCPEAGDCQLRARSPRDNGRELWRTPLPSTARSLKGPAPGVVTTRDPAGWYAGARSDPGWAPAVLGLRVQGGAIEVIDTVGGKRLREAATTDQQTHLSIAGERVLVSHSRRVDQQCRYTLEGHDAAADSTAWQVADVDLGTGSGEVCEQRKDPAGASGQIIVGRGDDHQVMLNATDGKVSWSGVPGAKVLATDGQIAIVLGPDRKTVQVVDLLAPPGTGPTWSQEFGVDPTAAITTDYVVIEDTDNASVTVLNHYAGVDGQLATIKQFKSKSTVCAVGYHGLLLTNGRKIGYIPLQ